MPKKNKAGKADKADKADAKQSAAAVAPVETKVTAPAKEIDRKKLQPIYDALDSRNEKAALKHLQTTITKLGNLPILLVCSRAAQQSRRADLYRP